MNLYKNVSLYIIILLLIGCGSKSKNNFLAGYLSPGDFCSKGLAREKAYRFTDISPVIPGSVVPHSPLEKSCSPDNSSGTICPAVHCIWYMSESVTSFNKSLPTEGIAVNDKYLTQPTFNLKISRVIGTPWYIEMVVSGAKYTASTDRIQITSFPSADVTDQTWNGTACVDSTKLLTIIYIEFLSDINLLSDPNDNPTTPTKPYVIIKRTASGHDPFNPPNGVLDGDFMVLQDYGI
jgi:hypothetical protein